MTLSISRALLEPLLADARRNGRVERCGLLIGRSDVVIGWQPTDNVAADPTRHFAIAPADLFAARRAARAVGAEVVGHYHSHPTGTAVPSARDAAMAHGDGALWLIVSRSDWQLWRAVSGGRLLGAFEPVAMRIEQPLASSRAAPLSGERDDSRAEP